MNKDYIAAFEKDTTDYINDNGAVDINNQHYLRSVRKHFPDEEKFDNVYILRRSVRYRLQVMVKKDLLATQKYYTGAGRDSGVPSNMTMYSIK